MGTGAPPLPAEGTPAGEAQKGQQTLGQTQTPADREAPCLVPSSPFACGPRRRRAHSVVRIIRSRPSDRPSETAPRRCHPSSFPSALLTEASFLPAPRDRKTSEAATWRGGDRSVSRGACSSAARGAKV